MRPGGLPEKVQVEGPREGRRALGSELGGEGAAALLQRGGEPVVAGESADRARGRLGVARRDEKPGLSVADDLWDPPDPRRDDGESRRHRVKDRRAEPLEIR